MSPFNWQKSTYCAEASNCVELASDPVPGIVHLRESDHPATVLTTASARLVALLAATRAGAYAAFTSGQR